MIAIPVRSRRAHKGQFVQKLQHAIPSVVVLGDGIAHLTHDPHGASLALGAAEVVVSVLVIGSVIRGFRRLRTQLAHTGPRHAHHGVDWIDLCLAAMLAVEAGAEYSATGHLARPKIVLAVAMFAIGLGHGHIAAWGDRRRELRVADTGLSIPGAFFRRHTMAWSNIASFDVTDTAAVITLINGDTRRLNLADAMEPAAIAAALSHARALHERSVTPVIADAPGAAS